MCRFVSNADSEIPKKILKISSRFLFLAQKLSFLLIEKKVRHEPPIFIVVKDAPMTPLTCVKISEISNIQFLRYIGFFYFFHRKLDSRGTVENLKAAFFNRFR